jgi:hypothetical protein
MIIREIFKTFILNNENNFSVRYEFIKKTGGHSEEIEDVLIYELNSENIWIKIDDKLELDSLEPKKSGFQQSVRLEPYPGNCVSSVKDLCINHFTKYSR